jgi:phage shock protein A
MNIWEKLMTALRGGVREAGEAIIDSQAMRILEQEISESADDLNETKASLVEIIARQKVAEEKYSHLQAEITKNENYARQALAKNEPVLALEVAEKIASLQVQLDLENEAVETYRKDANQLRTSINQVEDNIKCIKNQLDTVKATENIQQAQATILARHGDSNSRLHTAIDSLERIKEKQALQSARLNAASEMLTDKSTQALNQRLEDAGIHLSGKTAEEILEQLNPSEKK